MTGYFRRVALNAVKPGGSIQPVLDPLFSPPNLTTGPVSPEIEEQLTAPAPSEFTARTKPHPSPNFPDAPTLQPSEALPKRHRPVDLAESPLRIPAASVPRPQENTETIIVPRLAQKKDQPSKEKAEEPQRYVTMERRIKATGDPAINASSSSSFVPRFPALLPVPNQNPAPIIVRRLSENRSEQSHNGATKPQNESVLKPPPKQETEDSSEQTKSDAIAVSEDFGRFLASGAASTGVKEASKKLGSQTRHTTRSDPDEIQIHIGRIEVIAAPTALPARTSPKRKHGAPSLNEYLQKRNGRSV